MKAIRQHEFGEPDVLVFSDVPDPEPGPGQVRIAVAAAGVHLIDTSMRRGEAGPLPVPDLPMTPGREVAGAVDAVGPEVDPALLGRRVVARVDGTSGGYAELALAPAALVHELPDALDAVTAVAMIGTGRTALMVLDAAGIGRDDIVLVTAAAGGLGALFVQAGLSAGAQVVGVAGGPAKVGQVRALGAHAVDYLQPDWPEQVSAVLGGARPTVVLDGVGGVAGRAAVQLLRPGGRALVFGFSAGDPSWFTAVTALRDDIEFPDMGGRPVGERLRALETRALAAAAAGRWTPLVTTFPLSDAAGAHRALEERRTSGKVVLLARGTS